MVVKIGREKEILELKGDVLIEKDCKEGGKENAR